MKLAKLGDGPEIFHTLQGEGVSVGLPAVFIRASLCNLHCVWCDTDHTWNFAGTPWPHEKDALSGYRKHLKQDVIFEISPAEAAARIHEFNCKRTIITGGEPLLQEFDFLEMINHLRHLRPAQQIEVETNGTRLPSEAFYEAVNQFNISPKLANSGVSATMRLDAKTLAFFASSPKAWFKFVVANLADFQEIDTLKKNYKLPTERILLMPEGRTAAELDRHISWLPELCRDHGYRFCDRLHIRLWGDKRGV